MVKKLTLIDFFSGAGGFSEGFRQAGFDIIYATDNWKPATETFKYNNPDAEVVKADVLSLDASDVPYGDVVIGGPPCTEFSGSKRGGGGDFKKGLILVSRFLYYIESIKPRWWIMENVPRLLQALPKRFKFKDIGIDKEGYFEIRKMKVLNSADYGAPQKRLRLFSGVYPDPVQTHSETPQATLLNGKYKNWVSMRHVIEAFPNPLGNPTRGNSINDPNYDIQVDESELTDHFGYYCVMSKDESERNRKQKMEHPYYGKMKFPDDLDRPSRTVMATQFNASRETMVIEMKKGNKRIYRKPTIREAASLQCYPIDYKFIGSNPTIKYKLVGNSVPAKLSYAVAKAILREAGIAAPKIAMANTV
ncbi:MAG: DNA cytosine methyltransferase [Candidatus Micrarchaeota archaeon]|nr:DNA cytosine methyltransferase [Candidatus Micrarchaeota archaeon]MDE1834749.1 DNA cytosine methyltransferase [Candidatus Micrarchaeota archaeon]